MPNKKWLMALSIVIALSLLLVLVIITKRRQAAEETKRVQTPLYGTITTYISTTGTVQPQNRLELKPPISGRIEKIFVQEGDHVTIGQTLALLSSTERAALLDAARAQDEETVEYWRRVYKPTPLVAPINGEVIVRAVEPGQTVTSSDAVIVLSDRLIVQAQVDETDIGKVRLGQTAIVSLDAYPETKVQATIDHIAYESTIVNNVTIYEVDILPQQVPQVFRSGMSATIDIIEQRKANVLLIPREAAKWDHEGSYVLISSGGGGQAVKRRVQLGVSDDEHVEVISGLDTEDKIVIESSTYLPPSEKGMGSNPFTPFGRKKK